jgi:hypothetical protein
VTAAYGATTTSSMATRDSCFQAEAKFTCKAEMERREESLILAESQLSAFEKPTLNAGCPELALRVISLPCSISVAFGAKRT